MPSPRRLISTVAAATLGTALLAPAFAGAAQPTTTASTSSATADQVIVSSFSEKGDFINRGVSSVYRSNWATVTATTTGIDLVYRNPANRGSASYVFAPVAGQQLAVGDYQNVQRAESRLAGFAGVDVTGAGEPTGCSRVTGSFHVWDLVADPSGNVTRLDLTWVEHCGAGRPSNFGEVLINDAPQLGNLYASARRITFPDQTPQLPYVVVNPTPQAHDISLWQPTTAVSHYTVTPSSTACAQSVAAHSSCTYLLRLLPPRPGTYSTTVLLVSGSSILHLPITGRAGGV